MHTVYQRYTCTQIYTHNWSQPVYRSCSGYSGPDWTWDSTAASDLLTATCTAKLNHIYQKLECLQSCSPGWWDEALVTSSVVNWDGSVFHALVENLWCSEVYFPAQWPSDWLWVSCKTKCMLNIELLYMLEMDCAKWHYDLRMRLTVYLAIFISHKSPQTF